MRLYRQSQRNDWASPLAELRHDLTSVLEQTAA
jgi:hypothetical protein